MKYKTYPPMEHQLFHARRAYSLGLYGFLFEVGAGKTFATIITLRGLYKKENRVMRTLIISPAVTLFNWKDELITNSYVDPNQMHVIDGTGKKRFKQLAKVNEGIIIINYEALLNPDVFNLLQEFDAEIIVADESQYIKNYDSKRAKACVNLADFCRESEGHIFMLTGTMVLNSVADVYTQYRFLDGGERFGTNFYAFQGKYMVDENAKWKGGQNYFPKWVPRPETFEELNEKIYSIAGRVTKEEVLKDLPPFNVIDVIVPMSDEQSKMYTEMKNEFITFVQDIKKGTSKAVVANLALTKALRLIQITSGFVVDEEGDEYEIKDNPKLAATEKLLKDNLEHKVILWCNFKRNYIQLSRLCKKLGLPYVMLTGQQNTKEKSLAIKAFQEDPKVRVTIAHRRAGGIGVTLTASSMSIVYSRDFSLGSELQSDARNYRKGSHIHKEVRKYNLISKDTIDQLLLETLGSKHKLSEAILALAKS